jgi:hypothetical protein
MIPWYRGVMVSCIEASEYFREDTILAVFLIVPENIIRRNSQDFIGTFPEIVSTFDLNLC